MLKKFALSLTAASILLVSPLVEAIPSLHPGVTHAATYSYGYTMKIGYYDGIPAGFIATYASPFRDYMEVTYVVGAKWRTTKTCVTGTRIPDGWVITTMGAPHDPYTYSSPSYSTIISLAGAPIGTVEWVHPESRVPSGWAITEIRNDSIYWERSTMRIIRVN